MWMSLVRSNLSCKPEKKGFNKKIFLLQCSCTVRGKKKKKFSGKLKLEAKILQKGAF